MLFHILSSLKLCKKTEFKLPFVKFVCLFFNVSYRRNKDATVLLKLTFHLNNTFYTDYFPFTNFADKRDNTCGLATCRCDGKFAACVQVHQDSYDPRKKRTRSPLLDLFSKAVIQIETNKKR